MRRFQLLYGVGIVLSICIRVVPFKFSFPLVYSNALAMSHQRISPQPDRQPHQQSQSQPHSQRQPPQQRHQQQFQQQQKMQRQHDPGALIRGIRKLQEWSGLELIKSAEDVEALLAKEQVTKPAKELSQPIPRASSSLVLDAKQINRIISRLLEAPSVDQHAVEKHLSMLVKVAGGELLVPAVRNYLDCLQPQQLTLNSTFAESLLRNACMQQKLLAFTAPLTSLLEAHVSAGCSHISNLIATLQMDPSSSSAQQQLQKVLKDVQAYCRLDLNNLLRALGKISFNTQAVQLLQSMRHAANPEVQPDGQSVEFFLNALVLGMTGEKKDLPTPDQSCPEALMLGRSNVGKSSLVNAILNRKTLAPVSAVPGHTQALHLFQLQLRGARRLSIVDAPGLGYAESVDDAQRQGWRSLIQRYLMVRAPCRIVLHLVDHRLALTPVDKEVMQLVLQSLAQRTQPFRYVVLLTKADKAEAKGAAGDEVRRAVAQRTAELQQHLQMLLESFPVPSLGSQPLHVEVTSTKSKLGVELVWQQILSATA